MMTNSLVIDISLVDSYNTLGLGAPITASEVAATLSRNKNILGKGISLDENPENRDLRCLGLTALYTAGVKYCTFML